MKKNLSKTIMVILAVLLTLVLISTSTVSGIFAKYVVEKNATTIVSLKKFGIKLAIDEGKDFNSTDMSISSTPDDNTISVTISSISLAPGDSFDEIIKFVVTKDCTTFPVDTALKVKANVNTADAALFTVSDIGGLSGTATYIPIGFKYTKNGGTADNLTTAWASNTFATLESAMMNKLNSVVGNSVNADDDYADVKIAAKDGSSFINGTTTSIGFGCYWPATYDLGGSLNSDIIGTKIAEQGASISVTFTVSIEQITTTNS